MTIWLLYKAKPHERNKQKKPQQRQRLCRICGKPTTGGAICQFCSGSAGMKKGRPGK